MAPARGDTSIAVTVLSRTLPEDGQVGIVEARLIQEVGTHGAVVERAVLQRLVRVGSNSLRFRCIILFVMIE